MLSAANPPDVELTVVGERTGVGLDVAHALARWPTRGGALRGQTVR